MKKRSINILLNSTLAFISAFIFTTIFHEFGHYISHLIFGDDPIWFHNYVQSSDVSLSLAAKIISALAGPVFSLIQGLVLALVLTKNKGNSTKHLFMLWLSLLGFVNFFGYLIMTPISTMGDTGKVAELLQFPMIARVIIAIVGFGGLMWVIWKVAQNFGAFIPSQADKALRTKYVYFLMFFPIMVGSVVNALLAFPIVALLSVIYPATSPYVIMSSFAAILKAPSEYERGPEFEDQIMGSLVVLFLVAVTLNRLLTQGIG